MNNILVAPLPWQAKQWRQLYQLHQANRLPHALLFTGQAGLGKYLFAIGFAKTLLCKQLTASGIACTSCRDCLLVEANTHPDLSYVLPEKVRQGIKIEQIRAIIQQINQTTQSFYKIIIINPADSLLVAASNALLKSLEEPSERTLFILITDKPGLLLPTIRSRCQLLRFTSPDKHMGKTWLQSMFTQEIQFIDKLYALADAAPLQAIEYDKSGVFTLYQGLLDSLLALLKKESNPIQLAESYLKTDFSNLLYCLMKITSAILKSKLQMTDPDSTPETTIYILGNELTLVFLLSYFDKLLNLQQHSKIALNQQLMLEDLFCTWFLQEIPVS